MTFTANLCHSIIHRTFATIVVDRWPHERVGTVSSRATKRQKNPCSQCWIDHPDNRTDTGTHQVGRLFCRSNFVRVFNRTACIPGMFLLVLLCHGMIQRQISERYPAQNSASPHTIHKRSSIFFVSLGIGRRWY